MSIRRQQRAHPEQRPPLGRQAAPARARGVAAELHLVVEARWALRLPGGRHLPPHRDQRRRRRLGELRLREDARLPLGHLPRRPGRRPQDRLRRPLGQARVEGGPGRAPQRAPPHHRHAGRHRAGERRAAAPARPLVPERLRPPEPLPGERRGGPPPLGDGLPAPHVLRPRRPRGGRGAAPAPLRQSRQAAHPRRLQRAVHRLALVLHVHVLHRP